MFRDMIPHDNRPAIKSPRFDNLVGKKLSDKRITQYIREGRYGAHMQARQLREDARTKRKPSRTPSLPPLDISQFL